jgi:general secretion pathway protein F
MSPPDAGEPGAKAGPRTWRYRALDASGKDVTGQVEAEGEREALRALLAMDLTPLDVDPQGEGSVAVLAARRLHLNRAPKPEDSIQLLQELGTLLKAGVSLGEAMPSLALAYARTALGASLEEMARSVRAGTALGAAFRETKFPLPRYALALIDAGEASGAMAQALADAATQMGEEAQMRQELRNALTYPAVLVVSGIVAILIVFIAVVPRFATLLKGGRAEIPMISRLVIEAGLAVQSHLLLVGALAGFAVTAAVFALRSRDARSVALEMAARMPLIRGWLMPAEIGRWAAVLGALLENRVPLLEALRLSRDVLSLSSIRTHLDEALKEVRAGRALSDVFAAQAWLGPTQINLLRVGERTGELPRMLVSLASLQSQLARQRAKRMLTLIEPIAILFIGGVIGFLLVAVMLAITGLSTAKI